MLSRLAVLSLCCGSLFSLFGSGIADVPDCVPGTLSSYGATFGGLGGSGCAIGIVDYSTFQFSQLSGSLPVGSSIELTPSGQGFEFTLLDSNGATIPFTADGVDIKFRIIYQFTIDPGPVDGGETLRLDPPSGDVTITESSCNDGYLQNGTCIPNPAETISVTPANPFASLIFAHPAQNGGFVTTIFDLNGINGPATFDGVDGTQIISDSPEPVGLSLTLGGLLALAGARYVNRRRA